MNIEQVSEPVGFVSEAEVREVGETFQTVSPSLFEDGYAFGYWSLNEERLQDSHGRSLVVAEIELAESSTIVAHYFEVQQDSDGDGLEDWYEYRNFGDLDETGVLDYDDDGFSNQRELHFGQESTVFDVVSDGGISSRDSSNFVFGRSDLPKFKVYSSPLGFYEEKTGFQEINSTYTTEILNGSLHGYHFGYWTVNGERQAGLTGVASGNARVLLEDDVSIVAHYFHSEEDADADGILDWFEYNQFGDLSQGIGDDPDEDGFSNGDESRLGQEAMIPDLVTDGGISSRDSSIFVFGHSSLASYTIKSSPAGFLEETVGFDESGHQITSANVYGEKFGYRFTHWTINGTRQAVSSGLALSSVNRSLEDGDEIVAHYVQEDQDSDEDGIPDWYELNQFGDLNQGPNDDPDGDQYINSAESNLGQESLVPDQILDGGISSRDSSSFSYRVQKNRNPSEITVDPSVFFSNTENGEFVGTLGVVDFDDPYNTHAYSFVLISGEGDTANDFFTIDGVKLIAAASFSVGDYSIRVKVTDADGASYQQSLVLSAINDPNGDEDGDGLNFATENEIGTNHSLFDSDADGFSDGEEYSAGSDPLDPLSMPNRPPHSLELSNNEISENSSANHFVGQFTAIDPDGDDLSFGINHTQSNYFYNAFSPDGSLLVFYDGVGYQWAKEMNGVTLWSIDFSGIEVQLITMRFEDGRNFGNLGLLDEVVLPQPYNHEFLVDENGLIRVTEDSGYQFYNVVGYDPENEAIICIEGDQLSTVEGANSPDQLFFTSRAKAEAFHNNIVHGAFDLEQYLSEQVSDGSSTAGLSGNFEFPFLVDTEGKLLSIRSLDYEVDPAFYELMVFVSDSSGATTQSSFRIELINKVEDLDDDEIEDHYDTDDDGDGFTDQEEILAGADPRDAHSMPNRPPHSLKLSNITFKENQPKGQEVGKLSAIDPDGDELSFEITELAIAPESIDGLFAVIDQYGGLYSHQEGMLDRNVFTYSGESLYGSGVDGGDSFSKDYEYIKIGPSTARLSFNDGGFIADLVFYQNNEGGSFSLTSDGNWTEVNPFGIYQGTINVRFQFPFEIPSDFVGWTAFVEQFEHKEDGFERIYIENVRYGVDSLTYEENSYGSDRVTVTEKYNFEKTGTNTGKLFLNDGSYVAELSFYHNNSYSTSPFRALGAWSDSSSTPESSGYLSVHLNPPVESPETLDGWGSYLSEYNASGDGMYTWLSGSFKDKRFEYWEMNYVQGGNVFKSDEYSYRKTGQTSAELSFLDRGYIAELDFYSHANMIRVSGDLRKVDQPHLSTGKLDGHFQPSSESPSELVGLSGQISLSEESNSGTTWENMFGLFGEELFDYQDWVQGNSYSEEYSFEKTGSNSGLLTLKNRNFFAELNFFDGGFGSLLAEGNWTESNVTDTRSGRVNISFSRNNNHFYLDKDQTLRTNRSFDFETDSKEYSILVRTFDSSGASIEEQFTIAMQNVVEDLDGDGIEDHYDTDDDGDGFSDEIELDFGSDPRDQESVINVAPSNIQMTGGEFFENAPIGTIAAKFQGIDEDKNDFLTYSIASKTDKDLPFILTADGSLKINKVLDFENNKQNYNLSIRVTDEYSASFQKDFTIRLLNVIEDLDRDGIEDAFDLDRDGDGLSNDQEIGEGTDPDDTNSQFYIPIVEAGQENSDLNGSITFTGKIINDGDSNIRDVGFVFSSQINLDNASEGVWVSSSQSTIDEFSLLLDEPPFPGEFYIRAWANNAAGYGLSSVRKFTPGRNVVGWMGQLTEFTHGWMRSSWFGEFLNSENDWIYHTKLGWLFIKEAPELSAWMWHEEKGWLWTKEVVWPYIWSDKTQNWLYLYPQNAGSSAMFFDFSIYSIFDHR